MMLFLTWFMLAKPTEFTVVELFTSQGCSSCPPADALLAELSERPDILALSYHVDYWDYLGWRDPYGKAVFSELQRRYHTAIASRRYTPQMIVNGRYVFVGSRQPDAERALRKASDQTFALKLNVTAEEWHADRVVIAYGVQGGDADTPVTLALVQRKADNRVPAGENRGRFLSHKNVVRSFAETRGKTGRLSVGIPENLNTDNMVLILFTRDPRTMAITGALRVDPT